MKKLKHIITIFAILVASKANATVRTLNNNNPSPGQYTSWATVQSALNSSDTVYVSGSPYSYGSITTLPTNIFSITIIGTGNQPDKQQPFVSKFDAITLTGRSLVRLQGLSVDGINMYVCLYFQMSNCYVAGNFFTTGVSGSIVDIENNIMVPNPNSQVGNIQIDMGFSNYSNSIVKNNIIAMGTTTYYYKLQFLNNLVIGVNNLSSVVFDECIINNNIFYGASTGGILPTCYTTNNCVYPGTTIFDNDGNNIFANPLFVNVPAPPISFSYSHDYHLQPGSPCIGAGLSFTDIGLYGGNSTFKMSGEPPIPQMRQMNMPTTVLSGSSISVNIISTTK